ncbi:MAG: beta-glucosidase BglX [Bacteroidales bacterium]|nr:beta-glucosidase BglX [Bacteroidales bacterium]MBN2818534.1 beta-glucosidase BglX [Bacteroidales bacterium]
MRLLILNLSLVIILFSCSQEKSNDAILNQRVDSVLSLMTIQEKIGQMAQLSSWGSENRPLNEDLSYLQEIRTGRVGSMLNINGAEMTYKLQRIAVEETRLGIPLIFGFDVVHGYQTIFPIPIALSSTWDTSLVRWVSEITACEATSAGQHWTFAPMADVTRDPRWGRIAEGCGEDPFLTSAMVIAQIKGFQGKDLGLKNTMAACAKHFVAYGAAEGGRDYNTCEVSDRTLQEIYMPPFKAAADAGIASIMMALNDLNGVPSSSSSELKQVLRENWSFKNILVSDWNSIGELVTQGKAENAKDACLQAFNTSIDIDMQGNIYANQLEKLYNEKIISEKEIDNSVRRILKLKFLLGLFDDPYLYSDPVREKSTLSKPEFIKASEYAACQSVVLLKNKSNILPLSQKTGKIAVVGPLSDDKSNILGSWRAIGEPDSAVSVLEGIKTKYTNSKILHAEGCSIEGSSKNGFEQAIQAANNSDVIIAVMGERSPEVNKTLSASDISLPGVQRDLLKELKATGKPIVLILLNGRPIALDWESKNIDAIAEAWFPGTKAGNAIAKVISGEINPCAKLPVSFPHTTGQIPVYYNHKKFGRTPSPNTKEQAKYDDGPEEALFPFGYGLSYTQFEFSDLALEKNKLPKDDSLNIRVTVANTGDRDGCEIVQVYVRDLIAEVTRPILELKGFQKVYAEKGRSVEVRFKIAVSDLGYYNIDLKHVVEPGNFELMVGNSSVNYLKTKFTVID